MLQLVLGKSRFPAPESFGDLFSVKRSSPRFLSIPAVHKILNKTLGLFLMTAAAASSGCTAYSVRYDRDGGNPPFERADHDYPSDGAQSGDVFRVCFDGHGELYDDPQEAGSDLPARVSDRCRGGRPLLVLIHGCNNTYPEARRSYHLARMVVRDRLPDLKPLFLEVYWDALSGSPLALWGPAQENSGRVGLGLRRFLSKLDRDIPIRVVTHSRGGSVICSALEGDLPLPDDVRIGLLAPAMGPEALAKTAGERRLRRVLVAINEDDPVLGKGFLPATWFGDTSLGCSVDAFREAVEPAFGGRARWIDFSGSEVHDFKDWLLRRPFLEDLLPQLFEGGGKSFLSTR